MESILSWWKGLFVTWLNSCVHTKLCVEGTGSWGWRLTVCTHSHYKPTGFISKNRAITMSYMQKNWLYFLAIILANMMAVKLSTFWNRKWKDTCPTQGFLLCSCHWLYSHQALTTGQLKHIAFYTCHLKDRYHTHLSLQTSAAFDFVQKCTFYLMYLF